MMCEYCEHVYSENDYGRKFGKIFEKDTPYDGEVQLSWINEKGINSDYQIYMYDDTCRCDVSVPISFCPKCGRKLIGKAGK